MRIEDEDIIDAEDWKILLQAILQQGLDDYIKLQHPKHRRKKYIQEEFLNSIDMFFDPEYRFSLLKNDEEQDMSVLDLIGTIADNDIFDISTLQNWVINEADTYWSTKPMPIMRIPDTVQLFGHVYEVLHQENEEDYSLDLDEKKIYLNKSNEFPVFQRIFLVATLQLICHHKDLKISVSSLRGLATGLHSVLTMNECFLVYQPPEYA